MYTHDIDNRERHSDAHTWGEREREREREKEREREDKPVVSALKVGGSTSRSYCGGPKVNDLDSERLSVWVN